MVRPLSPRLDATRNFRAATWCAIRPVKRWPVEAKQLTFERGAARLRPLSGAKRASDSDCPARIVVYARLSMPSMNQRLRSALEGKDTSLYLLH
jgi:hypothetical protein